MGTLVFQATLGGSVNLIGPNTASTINFTLPSADGSSGQALTTNGSGTLSFATVTTGAAGSTTQVQYNSSGAFAGSANLTFNGTTLTAANTSITTSETLSYGTANGVTYLNGSKVLTSGSALTFDGTNLGLGVTPSAWSAYKGLQITGGASFVSYATAAEIWANGYYNGTNSLYVSNGYASRYQQTSGQHVWFTAASGTAGNAITFTQAMTLDASGNLGVGTTSPAYALDVAAGTLRLGTGSGSGGTLYFSRSGQSDAARVACDSSSNLQFYTGGSERGRFTSAGEFLLTGLTSPITSGILCIATNLNNNNPIVLKNTTTQGAGQTFVVFTNSSNAQAGAIQHSGSTSVTYSTSSDARLKTDLGVAISTDVIDNTIIHDFEWKEDAQIDRGVFAQEAYEVKPSAVAVGNDELTEDGNLAKPWGVDYSKYVPDLIVHAQQLKKQVQEQQAIIESLKARLDAANI